MSTPAKNSLQEIAAEIGRARSFLLVPHLSIDGDDLGSMIALKRGLEKRGKRVVPLCHEKIPVLFTFLPMVEEIGSVPPAGLFDCAVMIECTNPGRLPEGMNLRNHARTIINIDHHPGNTLFGDLNYIDCTAAAVGEIVYQLMGLMNIPLDEAMASALYVAMLTDTGSFQFSNTTSRTHTIAADLISYGIQVDELSRHVFRELDYNAQKLKGEVLSSMSRDCEGSIIFCTVTREMMERHGVEDEDLQHFIEDINVIRNSEIFVLLKEMKEGAIRVSLRSFHIPINGVARKYQGGGHPCAAGCTIQGSIEDARSIMREELSPLAAAAR